MDRFGIFSVEDYLALPLAHEKWLIRPFVPAGGSMVIYGSPKAGKSWLAIQLALCITGAVPTWLGFKAENQGPCVYLQLDNPDATWGKRFKQLMKVGVPMHGLKMLTRGTLEKFPFDILQPTHVDYLAAELRKLDPYPSCIIIDTIRRVHSGEEDDSTTMENVLSNITKAVAPAAVVYLHHNRKPAPDGSFDLMNDLRGSIHLPGSMDTIVRLTAHDKGKKGSVYFGGRDLEADRLNLYREVTGFWQAKPEESGAHLGMILADDSLKTMREKARALAPLVGKSESAALSIIYRAMQELDPESVSKEADLELKIG